jgi:hypothetical protein
MKKERHCIESRPRAHQEMPNGNNWVLTKADF